MGQGNSANKEYMQVLKEICDKDPINATFVTTYIRMLQESRKVADFADPAQDAANGAGQGSSQVADSIAEARKVFESSLRYNASQVNLWESYLSFLQENHSLLGNDADEQVKQVFERAIHSVGKHMKAASIWMQYINFETAQFHMGFSFLLCYVAVQTPLIDFEVINQK